MRKLILALIVMNSCSQPKNVENSNNEVYKVEEIDKKIDSTKLDSLIQTKAFQPISFCSDFEFVSVKERADSLLIFMERATISDSTNRTKWEKEFFCAFPNSFKSMTEIFGYDENGAAPLYSIEFQEMRYLNKDIPNNVIGFFSELQTIPKSNYYEKYININIGGEWDADNIVRAFGIHYIIIKDTKEFCSVLSQYTDKDVESVFRFIFDGPHPKNKSNESVFNEIYQKIKTVDGRLSNLLKSSYDKLISEDDGHEH